VIIIKTILLHVMMWQTIIM